MASVFDSYTPGSNYGPYGAAGFEALRAPQQQQQNNSLGGIPGSYGLYNTAVQQQAGDYGDIMSQYKNFSSNPAVQNVNQLAQTGGYSDADQANIRERGISPIRSIYSSAMQNVDRQKALQGGYSPNYGAVQAKMARELSGSLSDASTNVNAQLAQNIAQNKMSIAPTAANLAFQPIQGQQSLYGTTPALASTFGNQALQAGQLQNQINQAPAAGQQSWSERQRSLGYGG